jgi:hypothetical protein
MRLLDERVHCDALGHNHGSRAISLKARGLTGFMAGAVAMMVATCHSRAKEFRKSWNDSLGVGRTS